MLRAINFFKKIKTVWLILASVILLDLSFPWHDIWILAWVGLVPLLLALDNKRPWPAFWIGYITGFLFFTCTLYWFMYVTTVGTILLISYLALYFALFAFGYSFLSRRTITKKLFLLPCLWVALEFLRAHLLTGFGWASLGQSQYRNLAFIQIADFTGMFGVSFLVVMINVLIKETVCVSQQKSFPQIKKILLRPAVFTLCLILLTFSYGFYRLQEEDLSPSIKIALVQANTPQEIKWSPNDWPSIMQDYLTLTNKVISEKPDLIIWPETSFPGYVWQAPEAFENLKDYVAKTKIPLLLGLVTLVDEDYFNSVVLISDEGKLVKQHNKVHLVPFGEYIPLRNIFPFLSEIIPIDDFTAGTTHTLFPVFSQTKKSFMRQKNFSVLICFEDTIPELTRAFVNRGTNLLINMTNDAWFHDTKAPYLHLQASVFRTIENRRALVRAANTGISCFVNEKGKIFKVVQDQERKASYVSGTAIGEVLLNDKTTWYTKHGDILPYLCFGGILLGVIKRV